MFKLKIIDDAQPDKKGPRVDDIFRAGRHTPMNPIFVQQRVIPLFQTELCHECHGTGFCTFQVCKHCSGKGLTRLETQ